MELTDKYKKARQDILKAMQSMQDLSLEERQALARELFGAAYVDMAMKIFMSINHHNY